jgi:hypothetical protein
MFATTKNQINGPVSGLKLAALGRWGGGALLAAGVMACGVLPTAPAWAGPDESVQEITPDLAKAVGSGVVSVTAVDDTGNEVLYLRSDIYQLVSEKNYDTPVDFPVEPVSRIMSVTAVPGSTEGRVFIIYEASPAKLLECKWVGSIYRCF